MINKLKIKFNNTSPICIECSHSIDCIYKIYKDGFIDIVQCTKCNQVVDKYVECEYAVILIDLILFKQTAYRHIIYNRIVKPMVLMKFLLLFLLCDAYLHWFHVKNRQFESIRTNDEQLFYELEWGFYIILLNSLLDHLTFGILISTFLLIMNGKSKFKNNFNYMVKALVISSFGKLMVIPLVIWNPNQVFFKLADLFTYLSNAHALAECFTCGLEDGYRIYNTDPLKENCRESDGGIRHVEMLYRCNYIGLVGGGILAKYPRNKGIIWDDFQKKVAICLDFNTEVLAIKLRRDRIVVVFESMVKVYTFSQNPQLLHVFETCLNPEALCCLCSYSTNSVLAYPNRKYGNVSIMDLARTEKPHIDVNAHETAISYMALSQDGTKLATSSTKGTLIRVFCTETGNLTHELRRGANHANIYCINFNRDGSRLCVSSNHGTIHVFILDNPDKNVKSTLAAASFLPKYFQSKWSSFKFDIHNTSRCICAFAQHSDQHFLIALCMDGTYYKFTLDNNKDVKGYQLDTSRNFLEINSRQI